MIDTHWDFERRRRSRRCQMTREMGSYISVAQRAFRPVGRSTLLAVIWWTKRSMNSFGDHDSIRLGQPRHADRRGRLRRLLLLSFMAGWPHWLWRRLRGP